MPVGLPSGGSTEGGYQETRAADAAKYGFAHSRGNDTQADQRYDRDSVLSQSSEPQYDQSEGDMREYYGTPDDMRYYSESGYDSGPNPDEEEYRIQQRIREQNQAQEPVSRWVLFGRRLRGEGEPPEQYPPTHMDGGAQEGAIDPDNPEPPGTGQRIVQRIRQGPGTPPQQKDYSFLLGSSGPSPFAFGTGRDMSALLASKGRHVDMSPLFGTGVKRVDTSPLFGTAKKKRNYSALSMPKKRKASNPFALSGSRDYTALFGRKKSKRLRL